MPELPEVETMRRGILGIIGSRLKRVSRAPCPRKPIAITPEIDELQAAVAGKKVLDVQRAGKRVVVVLEREQLLVFEPRMTGLVLLTDPPSVEHLRVRVELSSGPIRQFWYWDRRGLGRVYLTSQEDFQRQVLDGKLGPDALAITPDELYQRLKPSSRAVKVALLDQRAVAGIGNLYASEILHLAQVHPGQRCSQVTRVQWDEIHRQMLAVLHLAIKYEGSTLSDGTYRNALNEAGGYQNHHRVYDRAGELCPSCRSAQVVRIVQTQRATFFCPTCQNRQKKRPAAKRLSTKKG